MPRRRKRFKDLGSAYDPLTFGGVHRTQHDDGTVTERPHLPLRSASATEAGDSGQEASDPLDPPAPPSQPSSPEAGQSPAAVGHVVAVLPGRTEVHFAVNSSAQGVSRVTQQKYTFVGVRQVQFQDQALCLGWCTDPACPAAEEHAAAVVSGQQQFSNISAEAFLQGRTPLCPFAASLLDARGGWYSPALAHIRDNAAVAPSDQPRHQEFAHSIGRRAVAVQHQPDLFESWAVLLPHSTGGGWFCSCCASPHACPHLQACDRQAAPSIEVLTPDMFEKKLRKDFDIETGERKLKCISRLPIPEALSTDAALLLTYSERSQGLQPVPSECRLVHPDAECPLCQHSDWGAVSTTPSAVVLPAARVQTLFESRACQHVLPDGNVCCGQLTVDGSEYGLLRKTADLAFSHELLRQYVSRFSSGSVDSWTAFWNHTVIKIIDPLESPARQAAELELQSLKRHFDEVTQDFVQLQKLDYAAGFRCNCWKDGVTLDGIALGYKKTQSHIVQPWQHAQAQIVAQGCAFADRIFLPDRTTRELLMSFAVPGEGLDAAGHAMLQAKLGADERGSTLLPFVQPSAHDPRLAEPENRHTLQCLASSAPVSQFLRPQAAPIVRRLLQGGVLSLTDWHALHCLCPILQMFLKHHLDAEAVPTSLSQLLSAAMQVAEAAAHPTREAQAAQAPPADTLADAQPDARLPEQWTEEESMLRTCSYGALVPEPWRATQQGGSDVFRCPPIYAADSSRSRSVAQCTKHQKSTANLVPGLMLYWCMTCRKCIFFHVMPDAESPRTVFEVLLTRFPELPKQIVMDNVCNLHSYILNREPEHFKDVKFYIDEAHFRGHKHCCPAYNTGHYPHITNSALAEQKNSRLRRLESFVSYMKQTTFMWYMRWYLYQLNMWQGRSDSAA